MVREEPDRVQSTVVEDVGFVDEQYRGTAAFGGFGGECVAVERVAVDCSPDGPQTPRARPERCWHALCSAAGSA